MLKNIVVANTTKIRTTKKIAVLLSFMVCPAICIKLFTLENSNTDNSRFYIANRACAAEQNTQDPKTDPTPPQKYATNIHIGHEISWYFSAELNDWSVRQKAADNIPAGELVPPSRFKEMSPGMFLRYTYNIPFSKNFGFFLGTTAGMLFTSMNEQYFHSGYSIFFPTILIGFTGTPIPSERIILATEYGATWYPEMFVTTDVGYKRSLNATLDMWNIYLENDYFFSQDIALSATVGIRAINNICKLQFLCSSSNYINTLRIRNTTYYAQIGLVFGDLR